MLSISTDNDKEMAATLAERYILDLSVLAAFLIACTIGSFGIAIASRMESMEGFQMVSNSLLMPMFFLSGAIYPLNNLGLDLAILLGLALVSAGAWSLSRQE